MSEDRVAPETARALAVAGELRTVIGQLGRRLRDEASTGDWTPSQTSVLARLERDGPTTLATLARAEGMRPQSMGTIIAVLRAAGLVAGVPDPSDGRQTLLSLTPAAREEFKAGRVARQEWLYRTIRARLTPDEQGELARSVALLRRLLISITFGPAATDSGFHVLAGVLGGIGVVLLAVLDRRIPWGTKT